MKRVELLGSPPASPMTVEVWRNDQLVGYADLFLMWEKPVVVVPPSVSTPLPGPFVPGVSGGGGNQGSTPIFTGAPPTEEVEWQSNGRVRALYPNGSASVTLIKGVEAGYRCTIELGGVADTPQRWPATFDLCEAGGGADPVGSLALTTEPGVMIGPAVLAVSERNVIGPKITIAKAEMPSATPVYLVVEVKSISPNRAMKLRMQAHDAGRLEKAEGIALSE